MKTTVDGQVVTPCTMHTMLPTAPASAETAAAVRARSRARYGRPQADVVDEIDASLGD